jgi:phosphoglycolate phosphatase-like HAD superfamily hydrolase
VTRELLRRYTTLFWDFDGVIKDSLEVKAQAFAALFAPFGAGIAARVRAHHECNGGLSRYQKLPLYLEWAGCDTSPAEVDRYCEKFSVAVRQAVIDCAWVPGVREYLAANHARQHFVLITATPQAEIEEIVAALGIVAWFREIHGAPAAKADAIRAVLVSGKRAPRDALLIGDSDADHAAAKAAGVDFLLRRTAFNTALQRAYAGPQCADFSAPDAL